MLRRLIEEHVELVVLPGAGAARVRVDAGQLEQVLVNLAVNARDAMPEGGTLRIATGTGRLEAPVAGGGSQELPSGEYALLSARDTCTGIDEEMLDRIFDPFFTTKQDGEGTGLGLATAHGIEALALAQRHEGSIDLLPTDVVMPGMSGRAHAERLTADRPGLPGL